MTTLEILLLVVVLGFGIAGFGAGLIQAIGSLVGVFVGTAVATRSYERVAGIALPIFGGNEIAASITSFIFLFLVTSRLVGLIVHILDKAFKFLAIFPGLKMLNRLGGFALGIIEGILVIGVVLNLVLRLPL
ncbi:MAG: CvpA family protein, partial [bacterium]